MIKTIKQRLLWADITRILAIYLVIVVHSSNLTQYLTDNNLIELSLFAFAKTCVPLFVMLSGVLLLGKTETYKVFFQKRFSRIVFPWIFWTIVTAIALIFISNIRFDSRTLFSTMQTTFWSFWFLPLIAMLYLITPFLRIFIKNSNLVDQMFVVVLWFIAISLLPYLRNTPAFPISVDNGLVRQLARYFGYFILGFTITKLELPKNKIQNLSIFLILIGLFLLAIEPRSFTNLDDISPAIFSLSAGLFIFFSRILNLDKTFSNQKVRSLIATASTFSLGIYLAHTLIIELIKKYLGIYPFVFHTFLDQFLNGGIVFVLAFAFLIILSKIPIFKRLDS